MKKTAIALALLSMASATAFAQQQPEGFDGFLSVGAGQHKYDNFYEGDASETADVINLRGSFAYTHKTGFGIQIDNVVDTQKMDISGDMGGPDLDGMSLRTHDTAFHGFYREKDFLVGVIYQTRTYKTKYDSDEFGSYEFPLPLDRTFTGIEAQFNFDDWSLYGLSATDKVDAWERGEGKGRINMLEARYFFNDNLRADLSYATNKFEGYKTNSYSFGVEYKPDNSPISFNAKYQNFNDDDMDNSRWYVGLTMSLGGKSLRERNNSGASLNPIGEHTPYLPLMASSWVFYD